MDSVIPSQTKKLRIDKWLWAVRIFKTRSLATAACKGGHVKLEGQRLTPSHCVKIGEIYSVERAGNALTIEVAGLLEKRLSASQVAPFLIDHTPPAPPKTEKLDRDFPHLMRPRGAGRPTKKERREIDSFFG